MDLFQPHLWNWCNFTTSEETDLNKRIRLLSASVNVMLYLQWIRFKMRFFKKSLHSAVHTVTITDSVLTHSHTVQPASFPLCPLHFHPSLSSQQLMTHAHAVGGCTVLMCFIYCRASAITYIYVVDNSFKWKIQYMRMYVCIVGEHCTKSSSYLGIWNQWMYFTFFHTGCFD